MRKVFLRAKSKRSAGYPRSLAPRWAEWARLLRERHARISLRSSPAMLLLRPQAAHTGLRVYRSQSLLTLRTTSNILLNVTFASRPGTRKILTRDAIVRQAAGKELAAPFPAMAHLVSGQALPSPIHLTRYESRSQHYHAPAVTSGRGPLASGVGQSAAAIGSIAACAVRHVQHLEEFVRTFRKAVRTLAEPERPARLVLQHTMRREELRLPAAMVLRPAVPAASETTHLQAPEEPRHERPASFAPPAAPAINIESLTSQVMDQIDRRVIAWRERMGRF